MQKRCTDPNTDLVPVLAFSDDDLIEALKDIFLHFGYDLSRKTKAQQQDIANRLSEVAHREKPWGYLYVHNFMYNGLKAGEDFKRSIVRLAALIDGTPIQLVKSEVIRVNAVGRVSPGAFIFGDSRHCANPACGIEFVSDNKRRRFCSSSCRKVARKEKRP